MAIQRMKLYVSKGVGIYTKDEIVVSSYRVGDESALDEKFGRINISEFEADVDVPELNTAQAEIEALEAGVQKEKAESQARVSFLLDRISKLKCLTHEVPQ